MPFTGQALSLVLSGSGPQAGAQRETETLSWGPGRELWLLRAGDSSGSQERKGKARIDGHECPGERDL